MSPHGISLVDGEEAIDWVCYAAENVYGRKIQDMPLVAQTNISEYGARLATQIDCNQIAIEGDMITRRLLFYIMSNYNPVCERPIYGHLFDAICEFLEKPVRDRDTIRRHCAKHFGTNSFFITKRPGERF